MSNPIILVVEDEALIRMSIVAVLEEHGFEVLEAANSVVALQLLDSRADIRAMFTDVHMPGGPNGVELAATVHDRWPPIKILVTSGMLEVRPGDLPEGGAFMPKPYNAERVARTLHSMLA